MCESKAPGLKATVVQGLHHQVASAPDPAETIHPIH